MIDNGSCVTCRYWQHVVERSAEGYQDEGLCRRRAPSPVPSRDVDYGATAPIDKGGDSPGIVVAWPRTFEEDWCGEWVRSDRIAGQVKANDALKVAQSKIKSLEKRLASQQPSQTEQQTVPATSPSIDVSPYAELAKPLKIGG